MLWVEDFIEAVDKANGAPLIIGENLLIAIVFPIQQLGQQVVLQLWDEVLKISCQSCFVSLNMNKLTWKTGSLGEL